MPVSAILRPADRVAIIGAVEDTEATQLMLEKLFDMKWRVRDIHAVVVGEDDGEAEEEEDA